MRLPEGTLGIPVGAMVIVGTSNDVLFIEGRRLLPDGPGGGRMRRAGLNCPDCGSRRLGSRLVPT